jgi:hypothetical protein
MPHSPQPLGWLWAPGPQNPVAQILFVEVCGFLPCHEPTAADPQELGVCASMRRPMIVKANLVTVPDFCPVEFDLPFDRQASIRTRMNPIRWIRCRVMSVTFRCCNLHDGLEPSTSGRYLSVPSADAQSPGRGLGIDLNKPAKPEPCPSSFKPAAGPVGAVESVLGFPSSLWKSASALAFPSAAAASTGRSPDSTKPGLPAGAGLDKTDHRLLR